MTAPPPPPVPGTDTGGARSLKAHAADARLLFGFAVEMQALRENAAYRQAVQTQCSIVVAENAMKWGTLRPGPSDFRFDEADELLAFCEQSRIRLRGHNLCWHESLPAWFASYATRANARRLLTDHIRTVAGRCTGRIHSWDVVNEAIHVSDGRPDGLRNSPWLQLVGNDYVEVAFRAAREADPSALLTYNDYGLEPETPEAAEKRAAVLLLLRRLRQRNVPIDAVGIQSHLRAGANGPSGTGLRQFIADCREMGFEIFVTEMDVSDRDLPAGIDQRDADVARTYGDYLGGVLQDRAVKAVLTWGVFDARTWLNHGAEARRDGRPQRPLLLDARFQPTRAFAAVRAAFDGRAGGGVTEGDAEPRKKKGLRL